MLTIFTDTDTDITPAEAAHYGYKLISMPYSANGVEVHPYVDFETFDAHSFYDMLRAGTMPTTYGLSPEVYRSYFEPELAAGNDVLYVHFSAAMSGTFDAMRLALKDLNERYPDRRIDTIDTKGITLGSLNIVKEIGDLYLAGKTADELLAWASVEVDKFATYFFADDLRFFKRSGRVSGLAAVMGGLIGIRPILTMGADGKMTNVGKETGRNNALRRLVRFVTELGEDVSAHRVIIGHADALPLAEKLAAMLREALGDELRVEFAVVNPTAGSHCGPDTVGVTFHAKHR